MAQNKRRENIMNSMIHPIKILTVTIESSFTSDSNCSSNQRTDAKGAGFAKPVVSSNIWSSLQTQNTYKSCLTLHQFMIELKWGLMKANYNTIKCHYQSDASIFHASNWPQNLKCLSVF